MIWLCSIIDFFEKEHRGKIFLKADDFVTRKLPLQDADNISFLGFAYLLR